MLHYVIQDGRFGFGLAIRKKLGNTTAGVSGEVESRRSGDVSFDAAGVNSAPKGGS
jgi:hypothetical protein